MEKLNETKANSEGLVIRRTSKMDGSVFYYEPLTEHADQEASAMQDSWGDRFAFETVENRS